MSSILIKDCRILQTYPPFEVLDGKDVLIEDGKIVEMASSITKKADDTIYAKGKTLMPGFVCGHHHYYSGLARGMQISAGPQNDFIQILKEWWWRLDRGLAEESNYYSSLICSMEAIAAGTTAIIDHHASPSAIAGSLSVMAKGMTDVGIRGIECYEVTDRNRGMKEVEEGVDENVRFAEEVDKMKKKDSSYPIEAMIGGHAPFTIPDEGLKLMRKAEEKTKRGMHLHIAEDKYDVVWSHHFHNKDIVARLDDFGLLTNNTLLVHGLHINDNEVDIINKRGVYFAHNARSNMNNHVGYCSRISKINNLILGTDGCGGNMLEEIKIAFLKHKDEGGPWWPNDFLTAETRANELLSKYFNAKFGRVEKDYQADLILIDYENPTPLIKENLAGHIVWGMSSNSVDTVIVNGKIVMEGREFCNIDKNRIFAESSKIASALWKVVDKIKP
ncbi:MAG TPA: putative aminohydrolase SsnA [Spirochaetaceae bacterium]|nr:putative aminohydrolase SsnA [Spirochaetaceae bacterium]